MATAEDNLVIEEWRDVPCNSEYEVSSLGRVRRKARLMKKYINPVTGYEYINLGRSYRGTIHRLVCEAFHGPQPTPEHKLVAHWDGVRTNNRSDNLRWATYSDNMADALRHGSSPLIQYRQGSHSRANHNMAKLTEADVAEIRRLAETDIQRQELARRFGISRNQLWRILTGKNWRGIAQLGGR